MSFNRKDLEDDDDFNFDDASNFDFDDNGDDFKFDDEPANIGLDDEAGGFGFEDEDMPEIDEPSDEGGGVSRTFVVIAALMILLFVLGLGAVLFIFSQQSGPTDIDLSATAIVATNQSVETQIAIRSTESAIDGLTQTAIALIPTDTPTLTPSLTPTIVTVTPTPSPDATQLAAALLLTQQAEQALGLTLTAEFLLTPPTQGAIDANDVALTATALAILLAPPTLDGQGGGGVPTQEFVSTPGVIPTALPDTGFFEDLAAGNANTGAIALMAFGLVGVIVISRRLRAASSK